MNLARLPLAVLVPTVALAQARPFSIDEATEKLFADTFVIDGVLNYTRKKDPNCRQNCESALVPLARIKAMTGVDLGSVTVRGDLDRLQRIVAYLERGPGSIHIATFNDIRAAEQRGLYGCLLYNQQVPRIDGDATRVRDWYRAGMRIVQLAYSSRIPIPALRRDNKLAGGADEPWQGLTELGRCVVREMVALHMIIDVSHCSEKTTNDVIAMTDVPILANHANAKALTVAFRGPMLLGRNKSDRELRAIAKTGGVVGINTVAWMLDRDADTRAGIDDFLAHVDYVVKLIGIDHVGLASDSVIDGWGVDDIHYSDAALASPLRWKLVAQRLRKDYRYTDEMLKKLLGGNFRRVYDAVLPGVFAPDQEAPADRARLAKGRIELRWKPAKVRGLAAATYECVVEVEKGGKFVPVARYPGLGQTTITSNAVDSATYRWRVVATSGRARATSPWRTFTIGENE